MTGKLPPARQAGVSDAGPPSLFADFSEHGEMQPSKRPAVRMLSVLQQGSSREPASARWRRAWTVPARMRRSVSIVAAGLLGALALAAVWAALTPRIAAPGGAAEAQSGLDASVAGTAGFAGLGAATSTPAPVSALAPAAMPTMAGGPSSTLTSSSSLESPTPTGPAKLEWREGQQASTIATTTADRVEPPSVHVASHSAETAPPAPKLPSHPRVVSRPRAVPQGHDGSQGTASAGARPRASPARTHSESDPDADLVAAIMARLEPAGQTGSRRTAAPNGTTASANPSTIAALVNDCNALADSAAALRCQRRICAGYWGKAQACPQSLSPADSRPASADTQPLTSAH